MIDPKRIDDGTKECLKRHLVSRLEGLRQDRQSFWVHWGQLAEMFLPRRYKWLVSANQLTKGSQMNQSIVDETGMLAARACASGMMAGMTSPTKVWFNLGLKDLGQVPFGPAKEWLDDCRQRILRAMAQSNFYTSLGQLYEDNAVFSSAAMIIYEDAEQIFRCYNPCLGEFYFGASNRQIVDTLMREAVYTVDQAVQEFGLEAVSDDTRGKYMQGGSQRTQELVVCHAIEPNSRLWKDAEIPLAFAVPASFPYREVYWEQAGDSCHLLRVAGFREKPFVGARWAITGNDAYGRGPGMDALPAVRQLQIEQRRKAEAIDKMVRPPMVGSVSMRNEPASILPGAITYVSDIQGGHGFKPAFQVDPRIAELTADIAEVQERVKSVFYVDLFMMIASLDTVRTATEIDARREEKMIQLGPVIERFENEVLDPVIDRVFSIMWRRGLLPEPPEEIQGADIDVQYISMLAEAQRAARTAGTERLLALAGNLAGVDPSVMDSLDVDALIADYADAVNVTPRGVRSAEEIEELRTQRAAQQAEQEALAALPVAADGAKTLSETDVGGGQNALAMMMGGL